LAFEGLEQRQLLAGNVNVSLDVNGNLVLTGDLESNHVLVRRGFFAGTILVLGGRSGVDSSSNTTINGQDSQSFSTSGGLILDMDNGNDRVVLTDIGLQGNLTGSLGSGNDQLALQSASNGPVSFTLNNGTSPSYKKASTSGLLNVSGSNGNDTLVQYNAIVGGNLTFLGGNGRDAFNSSGTTTGNNAVGGSVQLTPGGGDDSISILRMSVGGNFRVDDGSADFQTNVAITNLRANLDILMNLSIRKDVVTLRGEDGATPFQGRNITINTGNDVDRVDVRDGTMVNLTVTTGASSDRTSSKPGVSLNFLSIDNKLLLDTGDGNDWVFLGNITADSLEVDAQDGNDKVVANNLNVHDAVYSMFGGDDFLGLHESTYRNLDVFTSDDDDVLQVRNLTTTRDTTFNGGLGFNTYQDQGGNSLKSLTKVNFA